MEDLLEGYYRGGSCDLTNSYKREQHIIAKHVGVSSGDVWFLDHDVEGEICIYISGRWSGYLDPSGLIPEFETQFLLPTKNLHCTLE